jgi:hypothetical protein
MESTNRNSPSPKAKAMARHLLARETCAGDSPQSNVQGTFRVAEKLRHPLSTLVGATGFRALLARAVALARVQDPELGGLQVMPDGSLDGLSEVSNGHPAPDAGAVIAEILGLLEAFVGEELTVRLLADVWPDLPAFEAQPHGESRND